MTDDAIDPRNRDTILWARGTVVLAGLCSTAEAQDLDIPTLLQLADMVYTQYGQDLEDNR